MAKAKMLKSTLTFLLAAALLASCGGGAESSTATSSSTTASTATSDGSSTATGEPEEYTLPLVSESTVLKIGTLDNFEASASYTGEMPPVLKEIENRTGVTIQFEIAADGDYDSVMQTRLAAGTDLPDIIKVPGTDPMKFASTGVFKNMGQLIDQYAPNIKKLFEEQPDLYQALVCPDGNLYTISKVMDMAPVNMPSIIIRKDWLDNVGLDEPKTIDDWDKVFEAFKTQDPNGNGQNDEIPFCNYGSPLYMTEYFASAYGLAVLDTINYDRLALSVTDGKVDSDLRKPEMKDWLSKMNEWYSAGYFDTEMLTQTGEKWTSKVLGNTAGTVCTYSLNEPQWDDQMRATIPDVDWLNVFPPSGPAGDGFYYIGNGVLLDNQFAITKTCSNDKLAMQFIDYIYAHPEGSVLATWGIEGEDYVLTDGEPGYTDAILKSEMGSGSAIWARGIMANLPMVQPENHIPNRFNQYPDSIARMEEIGEYTRPAPIFAIASEEESSILASKKSSLDTYIDETLIKFILGDEPIENYDSFLQKLEEMGLQEVLDVKQAQYDRANQ